MQLQIAGRKSYRKFAEKLCRRFGSRALEKAQRATPIPHGLWLWNGFSGGDGEVRGKSHFKAEKNRSSSKKR